MSMAQRLRESSPSERAIVGLMVVFAGVTLGLALARYHSVHHRTFDLALYTRMAWGLAHGDLWEPIVGGNFFTGHAPLVLLPLGLLGRVFGTVETLLASQSVLLAAAAWPLSRLAKRHLGDGAAVIVALAWLLYPNLGHVATYEFHPGNLAMLPLAMALDALDRARSDVREGARTDEAAGAAARALLWCCMLVLACRVSLALQTFVIGLLALRGAPALRRTGALIACVSLAYFLTSQLLFPRLFGDADGGTRASMALHFGHLGGSPLGVIPLLIAHPAAVLNHLATPERLLYPFWVLAPLALLPLARPSLLLVAAPPLALNLLSQFPTATALYSHYLTPALPPLIAAAVLTLSARPTRARRSGLRALVATTLMGAWYAGGLPGAQGFVAADFRDDARSAERRAVIQAIQRGVGNGSAPAAGDGLAAPRSVQAPDFLLPHLAERQRIHRAPPPERETDLVVLDLAHRRRYAAREDLLRTTQEPLARAWLARSDHGALLARGDLVLLARGGDPRGGPAAAYFVTHVDGPPQRLSACLDAHAAHLDDDGWLWLDFHARAPCPPDLAIRLLFDHDARDARPVADGAPARPRVDLLFDGLLSPAHLREGDLVRSRHRVTLAQRTAIARAGLRIGALRASGARPEPGDPDAIQLRVYSPPTARPLP